MTISTYSELQSSVAAWIKRSDLTSQIPDFISLAETRIKSLIDTRTMEVTVDLATTASSDTVALPADFKSPIALWLADINPIEKLQQVLPQGLPFNTVPNRPLYWAIDGSNIKFQTPANQVYPIKFRYLQTLALSANSPTNYLLQNYPDVYLFGTLFEAADYTHDESSAIRWDAKFRDAVQRCNDQEASNQKYVPLLTEFGQIVKRRFNIYRGF